MQWTVRLMTATTPASNEEFGAGWSALAVKDEWVLFEPCVGAGSPRPAELGPGMWCIITSDNPGGLSRSAGENQAARKRLWAWVHKFSGAPLESRGGIGSVGDPDVWPASEMGVAVQVTKYDDAVGICNMFQQAAVYLLVDNQRHLIDRTGKVVLVQRYQTYQIPMSIVAAGATQHAESCLCPLTRYDGSPFEKWACVWGEVWDVVRVDGFPPTPVRVFYGRGEDGRIVLLRAEPDAELTHLSAEPSHYAAWCCATAAARRWSIEIGAEWLAIP